MESNDKSVGVTDIIVRKPPSDMTALMIECSSFAGRIDALNNVIEVIKTMIVSEALIGEIQEQIELDIPATHVREVLVVLNNVFQDASNESTLLLSQTIFSQLFGKDLESALQEQLNEEELQAEEEQATD